MRYIFFGNSCYKYLQKPWSRFFTSLKRRKSTPPYIGGDSALLFGDSPDSKTASGQLWLLVGWFVDCWRRSLNVGPTLVQQMICWQVSLSVGVRYAMLAQCWSIVVNVGMKRGQYFVGHIMLAQRWSNRWYIGMKAYLSVLGLQCWPNVGPL